MREGHLLRHLRGMRRVYASRRKALIDAIAARMPDDLTVSSAVTGLHLVALFTDAMQARMSDREAAASLKKSGIHVQPLSQNFLEQPTRQGLVFGYGRLHFEDAAPLLARIATCIGSDPRKAPPRRH
jgi:GntR family transcriptional regulator/MocR family aminotransferase